jgi:L-rhamnose mutarotase
MYLNPGQRQEYQRRHDEIWPELAALLAQSGIQNYSIFFDGTSDTLIGYLERTEGHTMAELPNHPVMKKGWNHMKDIMQYNADGTPVAITLDELFHLH